MIFMVIISISKCSAEICCAQLMRWHRIFGSDVLIKPWLNLQVLTTHSAMFVDDVVVTHTHPNCRLQIARIFVFGIAISRFVMYML